MSDADDKIDGIVKRACKMERFGVSPALLGIPDIMNFANCKEVMMGRNDSQEMDEYYGIYLHETDKAILFVSDEQIKQRGEGLTWDSKDELWLPKSRVRYNGQDYKKEDPIVIEIPKWLAEEKGLV